MDLASREKKGYSIGELTNLAQLRHLRLRDIQNIEKCEEILDAKLKEKKQLRTLSLHWSSYYGGVTKKIYALVLENFQPHPDLEGLDIIGYNGTRLPFWMTNPYLVNLASLKIINCGKMEHLPSLTVLCSLKNLYLQELSVLVKVGCFSSGKTAIYCSHSFAKSLSSIVISEETDYTGSSEIFPPLLNTLIIRGCPRLRELPPIPPRLNQLKILSSGLIVLPCMHPNSTEGTVCLPIQSQLNNVLIEGCQNLTNLADGFLQQHVYLESLKELHIYRCENLEQLPPNGLMKLVNLQILEISYCEMLKGNTHDAKLLPSSLEDLCITSCGELENTLIGSLTGLNTLTFLNFSKCNHLTSLPSAKYFETLTALRVVTLHNCPELSSLGGLQCLESLRHLSIQLCCKLAMTSSLQTLAPCHTIKKDVNGNSLKVETLLIDDHSLLFVEPVRSIRFARELSIWDDSVMTSLPEQWLLQNWTTLRSLWICRVKSLKCLPSSLANLCNLQSLSLFDAPLVDSLPEFPASLGKLTIQYCHQMLDERCRRGGCDWSKIAHIPVVKINVLEEESS